MGNVIITSNANNIIINYGDYAAALNKKTCAWRKSHIMYVLSRDDEYVEVGVSERPNWLFSYEARPSSLIVDTVGGVVPTDNDDLFIKLSALL